MTRKEYSTEAWKWVNSRPGTISEVARTLVTMNEAECASLNSILEPVAIACQSGIVHQAIKDGKLYDEVEFIPYAHTVEPCGLIRGVHFYRTAEELPDTFNSVSYTHLTLPTKA